MTDTEYNRTSIFISNSLHYFSKSIRMWANFAIFTPYCQMD